MNRLIIRTMAVLISVSLIGVDPVRAAIVPHNESPLICQLRCDGPFKEQAITAPILHVLGERAFSVATQRHQAHTESAVAQSGTLGGWDLLGDLDGMFLVNRQNGLIRNPSTQAILTLDFKYYGVRHGQAEGNVRGVLSGSEPDLDRLTAIGEEQAKDAAQSLYDAIIRSGTPWSDVVVIASPLQRPRATADIFCEYVKAKTNGKVCLRVQVEPDAIERNYGDLSGTSKTTLISTSEHLKPNALVAYPGGESFLDVLKRRYRLLLKLNDKYKRKTVIEFGHESGLRATSVLLADPQAMDEQGSINWRQLKIANGVPILLFDPGKAALTSEQAIRITGDAIIDGLITYSQDGQLKYGENPQSQVAALEMYGKLRATRNVNTKAIIFALNEYAVLGDEALLKARLRKAWSTSLPERKIARIVMDMLNQCRFSIDPMLLVFDSRSLPSMETLLLLAANEAVSITIQWEEGLSLTQRQELLQKAGLDDRVSHLSRVQWNLNETAPTISRNLVRAIEHIGKENSALITSTVSEAWIGGIQLLSNVTSAGIWAHYLLNRRHDIDSDASGAFLITTSQLISNVFHLSVSDRVEYVFDKWFHAFPSFLLMAESVQIPNSAFFGIAAEVVLNPYMMSAELINKYALSIEKLKCLYAFFQKSKEFQRSAKQLTPYPDRIGWLQKMGGRADYWNRVFEDRNDVSFPYAIEFHLGKSCQLNCRFCYNFGQHAYLVLPGSQMESLSLEQAKAILDEYRSRGMNRMFLSGGLEPLASSVATPLVEYAVQNGFIITTTSNGIGLNPNNREVFLGTKEFRISLQTVDPEEYKEIHLSSPKLLEITKRNIEEFVKEKKRKMANVKIGFATLLKGNNYHRIYDIIEYAMEAGVDFVIFRGLVGDAETRAGETLTAESLQSINTAILRLRREIEEKRFGNLNVIVRNESFILDADEKPSVASRCWRAMYKAVVDPFGRVFDCVWYAQPSNQTPDHMSGVVRESPFEVVWDNSVGHRESLRPSQCNVCNYNESLVNWVMDKLSADRTLGIGINEQPFSMPSPSLRAA